jgi:hypothetical protein
LADIELDGKSTRNYIVDRPVTDAMVVLTRPSITQSKQLYICISEINKMLSLLNPIDNLMNVLRDHKTTLTQEEALKQLENPESGVIITRE